MIQPDTSADEGGRTPAEPDFSRLLEHLPGFAYQRRNDINWSADYLSGQFQELTGLPADDLLNKGHAAYSNLIHPDDREKTIHAMRRALEQGGDYSLEYRINLPDRGERWFADHGCGVYDDQGQLQRLTGFVSDITQRKQGDRELERSEDRFRQLLEASRDAISVIDLDGRLLDANRAAPQMFGCPDRDSFLKLHPAELSPDDQPDGRPSRAAAAAAIAEAYRQGSLEFPWQHKRLDSGETFETIVGMHRIDLDGKPALLVRVSDVSEQLRYQQRLRQLAFEDPLTGLANRQAALEWLDQQLQRDKGDSLLVLSIDIDNFQWLNNTFGRDQCDSLLVTLARALRAQAGSAGLAARLQSDEFLVITRLKPSALGANPEQEQERQVGQLLAGLQATLSATPELPSVLSFCIGCTLHSGGPLTEARLPSAETLLQQANTALSEARRAGANQHAIYEPGMNVVIERRLALESRLAQAIAGREFTILYQPIVARDGRVVAAEGLMRWPQPDGAWVSPGTFIPLAEKSGRIRALGQWLIDSACAQLAEWRGKGLELGHLSINISPTQLCNSDDPLQQQLLRAIERHRLPAAMLQLEITESAVLENMALARQELESLAAAGFRLALDDFGTGYSSLLTLQRLPFDALKIDKSFVQKAERDDKSRGLVESCVSIAQKLELDCVAEGVETELQCLLLRRMGCNFYQGYLFDRPLPAAELETHLRSRP
jgi:diguanylate cyclase (GGDEF)-like protein/PAS domain S-box-containing protein